MIWVCQAAPIGRAFSSTLKRGWCTLCLVSQSAALMPRKEKQPGMRWWLVERVGDERIGLKLRVQELVHQLGMAVRLPPDAHDPLGDPWASWRVFVVWSPFLDVTPVRAGELREP